MNLPDPGPSQKVRRDIPEWAYAALILMLMGAGIACTACVLVLLMF